MKQLRSTVAAFLVFALGFGLDTPLLAKKEKKNADIDEIGSRNVNKGNLNFISIEKEIALGKSLAQEVEPAQR